MKYALVFLVLTVSAMSQNKQTAQADSLVWFTPTEVNAIATRMKVLNYKLAWFDSLTYEYKMQVKDGAKLVAIKDSIIRKREQQIKLHEANAALDAQNMELLKRQIDAMRPSVFENPALWCTVGLGLGYLLFHN